MINRLFIALLALLLHSCVHREFDYPSPDSPHPVEVELELQYLDKEMPLHTVVDYGNTESSRGDLPESRHIIKVYDSNRKEVASVVLADEADNATATRRHSLSLMPGRYMAVAWTDYVGTRGADWFYDSSVFPDVELRCTSGDGGFLFHTGNTPWRDAYCGRRIFNIGNDGSIACDGSTDGRVLIEMRRPMARFVFEATDFGEFADKHALNVAAYGEYRSALAGYDVIFRYGDYMPSVFSAETDAPVDSRVGASFSGEPRMAGSGSGAVEIGSDFVFVHSLETSVKVFLEVCDRATGNIVARAGPITVPLLRNRLTIVRGRFLTSRSGAGMVIDTGFDGEYNIEFK